MDNKSKILFNGWKWSYPGNDGVFSWCVIFNIQTEMYTSRNIKILILNYSQKTENGTVLSLKRGTTLDVADCRSGTVSEGSGTVPCCNRREK